MEQFLKFLFAFLVGGAFCVIAQILLDKTKLTPARILVGFVVAGVFLGAIGVYGKIVEFAGAGATTPLSGFGNLIAGGVREAVDKQGHGTSNCQHTVNGDLPQNVCQVAAAKEALRCNCANDDQQKHQQNIGVIHRPFPCAFQGQTIISLCFHCSSSLPTVIKEHAS